MENSSQAGSWEVFAGTVTVFILIWAAIAYWAGHIARSRGRSFNAFFVLGIFTSLIAVLIAVILPVKEDEPVSQWPPAQLPARPPIPQPMTSSQQPMPPPTRPFQPPYQPSAQSVQQSFQPPGQQPMPPPMAPDQYSAGFQYCGRCGKQMPNWASFCPGCGAQV